MGFIAKLTTKGQITIPKSVRAAMGLQEGDLIEFKPNESGSFDMGRHKRKGAAEGVLAPFLEAQHRAPTTEEMDEAIAQFLSEKAKQQKLR